MSSALATRGQEGGTGTGASATAGGASTATTSTAATTASTSAASSSRQTQYGTQEWNAKLEEVKIEKEDLNALVMNYLITVGYPQSAMSFAQESSTTIPSIVSTDEIEERRRIRDLVLQGRVWEAMQAVNEIDEAILNGNPSLFFSLQQLRLIELIRADDVKGALAFATKVLGPIGQENPELLGELERTMALLIFDRPNVLKAGLIEGGTDEGAPQAILSGEATSVSKSSEPVPIPPNIAALLHPSFRHSVALQLNASLLSHKSQEPEARLLNLIKTLRWSESILGERARFPEMGSDLGRRRWEEKADPGGQAHDEKMEVDVD